MEVEKETERAIEKDSDIKWYYMRAIEKKSGELSEKLEDMKRLDAQRNKMNMQIRLLREEQRLLLESPSKIGQVVKVMGKQKVMVKIGDIGRYVVDVDKGIPLEKLTPGTRVGLKSQTKAINRILPNKVFIYLFD